GVDPQINAFELLPSLRREDDVTRHRRLGLAFRIVIHAELCPSDWWPRDLGGRSMGGIARFGGDCRYPANDVCREGGNKDSRSHAQGLRDHATPPCGPNDHHARSSVMLTLGSPRTD